MPAIHNTRYEFCVEIQSKSKITRAAAWVRRQNELNLKIARARRVQDTQLEQQLLSTFERDRQLAEAAERIKRRNK